MDTVKLKSDTALRKRLMAPDAFLHPAKMPLTLVRVIADRYGLKTGDWVLDPMAGCGSTMVLALQGINVCLVELEQHFVETMTGYTCDGKLEVARWVWVEPVMAGWYVRAEFGADTRRFDTEAGAAAFYRERMATDGDVRGGPEYREAQEGHWKEEIVPAKCGKNKAHASHWVPGSWAKMRQNPMLGYTLGEVVIVRGDARALPLPDGDGVGVVLTSPPFETQVSAQDPGWINREFLAGRLKGHGTKGVGATGPAMKQGYTRPDAILTSPPWEDVEPFQDKEFDLHGEGPVRLTQPSAAGYTHPDTIISSPPYEGSLQGDEPRGKLFETERRVNSPASGNRKSLRKPLGQGYSKLQARADRVAKAHPGKRNVFQEALDNPDAVSRRGYEYGYTRPSVIVTSPPYEGTVGDNKEGPNQTSVPGGWKAGTVDKHGGYTRPSAIVTSPPWEGMLSSQGTGVQPLITARGTTRGRGFNSYGQSTGTLTRPSAIVTSPPFSEARHDDTDRANRATDGRLPCVGDATKAWEYGASENIGNLRGPAYWESMAAAYRECHRVLKPGGLLVLVLKGFTREREYVDLPALTAALVESLGFTKFDHWRRELPGLSFWRILQKKNNPESWDERLRFEEVLAFRKGVD